MAVFKRGRVYWYHFCFNSKHVQESTKQGNPRVARQMEAAHRTSLAKGEVGIREKKPVPTLAEFLRKDFLPYSKTKFESKPNTRDYYAFGAKRLLGSELAGLQLNEVTDKHAAQFAAKNSELSPSTINCGLRTLRRALNLAYQWGGLERPTKVTLARGERQRERVLTTVEINLYLAACPQPWRDVATIMLGTGMRPGEVYALRWEHVLLNGEGGLIQVAEGKSRAARRLLPMVPEVYRALRSRNEAQGKPAAGWVFPSTAKCGHLGQGTTKTQHSAAISEVNAETTKENLKRLLAGQEPLPLPLPRFEPYCMRHTALTRLAEAGCDAFTLARIAGHSSITITQRYCHPQAEAIERAFQKLSGSAMHAGAVAATVATTGIEAVVPASTEGS